jgi:hypothetical protein
MFEPNAYDNNDQHFANDQIHDKNGSFALAFYYHDTEIKHEINQPEDYSEDFTPFQKLAPSRNLRSISLPISW